MAARHETHLLIKELQREKRLETQAKQEQAAPVTQDVRSKPEKQAKQEQVLPVTVPQAVSAEEVTVPVAATAEEVTVPVAAPAEEVTVPLAATAEEVTAQAAKFRRWQRLFCRKSRQN